MPRHHWLMKVEPSAYTIDDLARDGRTGWEGVRNYKARNYLRDEVTPGDGVLFYQSNADPSGVAGLAKVVRAGYPDPTQFQRDHHYHDPKSPRDAPRWFSVDIEFVRKFDQVVPLAALKANPKLADMMVTKRGMRLSVQPVERRHYDEVVRMADAT